MRATIPVPDEQRRESVDYCMFRVREYWPDAVIVCEDERVCTGLGSCEWLTVVPSFDRLLSSELFGCSVPRIRITHNSGELNLEGNDSIESTQLIEMLAELPFWAHKVVTTPTHEFEDTV